jgi:formate dehydrogenase subunit beta
MKQRAADCGQQVREAAKRLLKEKKVGLVVGYAKGTASRRAKPAVVKDEKDADRLVFDDTCGISLLPHLRKALRAAPAGTKAAIVAKGCDGRALVQYIVEGQLKRDDVVIIGANCEGVVSPRAKEKAAPELDEACGRCRHPVPPVYDVLVGELDKEQKQAGNEFAAVEEFEKLPAAERWAWFERELAKCIRCYACRNACPMCYCDECFVDQTNPLWLGKSAERPDTTIFHIVRALHTAGRCVDCGACERACPVGVKLSLLNQRIAKEVKERFGYSAGLSLDAKPAMAVYDEDDRQEFIL